MATSADILERLGGVSVVASKLNLPLTTVQGWKDANFVPDWRKPAVIALSKRMKKPVALSDFPTADERISRAKKAAAPSQAAA